MKSKGTIILFVGILVFVVIYIGIYIGRVTSENSVYVPDVAENSNTLPEETKLSVVELNTATIEELCNIPGISSSLAAEIIAYREEYGEYVDVDELLEIDGITKALYNQIKDYVIVNDARRRAP